MKTMRSQHAVLPLALLSAAFMLACQDQGLEPVGPEGLAPLFGTGPTCQENPNRCKDKGGGVKGGDKSTVSVELDIGMVTPVNTPQPVQLTGKNNAKTLTLRGKASYAMALTATRDKVPENCASEGAFDGDFSALEFLELIGQDPEQSRNIFVVIDKEANGQPSLKQWINSAWREEGEGLSGNTISMGAIAGNDNPKAFALLPGATAPMVTAEDLPGGRTKFTFLAGHGIMWITQLGFDGLLVCHNQDNVEVIVDLTP